MHIPFRYVQLLKHLVWLTRCVSLFSLLCVFTVGAAWGQDASGVMATAEDAALVVPMGLVPRVGDRSVILHWDPLVDARLAGYRVYRAPSATGPFEPHSAILPTNHFVDVAVENGSTYRYRVRAVDTAGRESHDSATISATPQALADEAFLDLVQHTAFDYFWYETNPANGLIKDRSSDPSLSSIAAVGFGLSALTVGIDRGWISREAGRARALTTLTFLWNSPQGPEADATGYHGFYYHFLDMQTGRRDGDSELSTIDTALLLGGVLHMQQYFDQPDATEAEIRALADAIYRRVDWPWMQVRSAKICHGWTPETGFLRYDWGGYNEAMILYLLALSSPSFPINADAWTAWTSSYAWQTHYGQAFVVFPPLFGHQYSHVWIDFRNIQDTYMRAKGLDYFENSRRATLANRAYAMANPHGWADYGENVWGLTASDIPSSYKARGAPPAKRRWDHHADRRRGLVRLHPARIVGRLAVYVCHLSPAALGALRLHRRLQPQPAVVCQRVPGHRPGAHRAHDRECPNGPHLARVYAACGHPAWVGACRVCAGDRGETGIPHPRPGVPNSPTRDPAGAPRPGAPTAPTRDPADATALLMGARRGALGTVEGDGATQRMLFQSAPSAS
jgi:hypothetical protein